MKVKRVKHVCTKCGRTHNAKKPMNLTCAHCDLKMKKQFVTIKV